MHACVCAPMCPSQRQWQYGSLSEAKQNNMFVSGYPTYPSSRGRVYCFYCIIAHRLAMFLLRPKRLRLLLPTLDILLAMPIKLVTRADPRKLILNQTFTLNGYMWTKIPAHYQEESLRVFFESFYFHFVNPELTHECCSKWLLKHNNKQIYTNIS